MTKSVLRIKGCLLACAASLGLFSSTSFGQTHPSPLSLPVDQTFGAGSFSALPSGFAAWNGLSGSTIDTQPEAEASSPTGDASVMTTTPSSGGTGGCYGYAAGSDARFGILNSSNSSNGVNQLVMAVNTSGQTNITFAYDLISVVANSRAIGTVTQYRVGTSGSWTSLVGSGNPYLQSGGTEGAVSHVSLTLPAAAENKPVVQIRWAVWRAAGSGSSSGFAIDNISVEAGIDQPIISSLTFSDGPTYDLDETSVATVTLSEAPETSATVSLSSGAFMTTPVTITAPETTGQVEVTMDTAGNFVAQATAVSGCGGTAVSSAFSVVGDPMASFASTGVNTIDDSLANGNGYIDPGENDIRLQFEITNNGTAVATGVSAILTSLSGTVSVVNSVQFYPNIPIGASRTNTAPFEISVSPSHVCGATIDLQLDVNAVEGGSTFVLSLPTCPPVADLYSAPADYYLTATGVGSTLKNQLHNIVSTDYWNGFLSSSTHQVRSYDAAKSGLQITDLDPNNSNNLILIYTGISVAKAWDSGNTWNREHQWPDSRGINGSSPAYSDLHNLRPCNSSLNSTRGNLPFGVGGGFFDPDHGSPDRGRVARSMFYMNTRYNGTSPNPSLNLVLVNGSPSGNQMGDLASLVEWHYANPVDTAERRRNQAVFSPVVNPSYYQGNRNPYVDHPEYVWSIYGTGPNDSTLYFGSTIPGDGASSNEVQLGTILVNTAIPSPQVVTLRKSGSAPTTYNVSAGGSAVSPAVGTRQAFVAGVQTRNISAGLIGSTASAGLKTGMILINNTDLTSAGLGRGSADGNDTIQINLAVLDHAVGSFTAPAVQTSLTIDFGDVAIGSGTVSEPLELHNLPQSPGFTADLDLDSLDGSGDSAVLTTDLTPFAGLSAGGSENFSAYFDTDVVGDYSATYTLHWSDENLPGESSGNLILTLVGHVVENTCNPADTNCSSVVSTDDIGAFVLILLGDAAPCSRCAGDMNGDMVLDGLDIELFTTQIVAP